MQHGHRHQHGRAYGRGTTPTYPGASVMRMQGQGEVFIPHASMPSKRLRMPARHAAHAHARRTTDAPAEALPTDRSVEMLAQDVVKLGPRARGRSAP